MSVITEREKRLLQFDEILSILAGFTLTPMGLEKVLELMPSIDLTTVNQSLRETSEACELLEKSLISLNGIPDIRHILKKVSKNGILTASEAFDVKQFISSSQKLYKNMQKEKVRELSFIIKDRVGCTQDCANLTALLEKCITPEKEVAEDATPLLKDVSQRIKRLNNAVQDKLNNYIKSPSYRKYLQEPLITIRNNRYVIPVKQEYRSAISGIFHDQSSSGATLFIEPFAVADIQNSLQQEKNKRDKEIERILALISAEIDESSQELWNNLDIYGEVDFILAKGRLSFTYNGMAPHVLPTSEINIKNARHPLLKGKVVPVDLELGISFNTMVITGPNTGGKTVTLKTAGLLIIMVQSGLHIPVSSGSMVGLFKKVRCDIGDEQSIEQSLSTFSSHLNNIISIVKEADDYTLILLDELGAGTDPSEGAALARAILHELHEKKSLVIATTHINDLKIFAQVTPGVENASLEFDEKTLAPTYNLITGVPGSSNALSIAGKLGLDYSITEKAKSFLSTGHEEVEAVINSLNKKRKRLSEDSLKAALELRRAETLRAELEKERETLMENREKVMAKARYDAKSIIKRAKIKADESIGEIDRILSTSQERKKALQEAETVRRSVRSFTKEISAENVKEDTENIFRDGEDENEYKLQSAALKEKLKEGDRVALQSLKKEGVIKRISTDRKSVSVEVDDLLVKTKINDIYIPAKTKQAKRVPKKESKRIYSLAGGSTGMNNEISLRGLILDEAVVKLDKFLDNAVLYGLDKVFIIHGRGTGKLRRGVGEILKTHKSIKEFRIGYPEEGGIGVTVAYLKK